MSTSPASTITETGLFTGAATTLATESATLTRHWPKYQYGDVYTYNIIAEANRWQKSVTFGPVLGGNAPPACLALTGKSLSSRSEVNGGYFYKGTQTGAMYVKPPLAMTLSDGVTVVPYMMTVQYDSPNFATDGFVTATAQFFNGPDPQLTSSVPDTVRPPLRNMLVQDRIMVLWTADSANLSFQFIGDRPAAMPSCFSPEFPAYTLQGRAADWPLEMEYVRDPASGFLDLWSPLRFPTHAAARWIHHFVPYRSEPLSAASVPAPARTIGHGQR